MLRGQSQYRKDEREEGIIKTLMDGEQLNSLPPRREGRVDACADRVLGRFGENGFPTQGHLFCCEAEVRAVCKEQGLDRVGLGRVRET